MDRYSDRLEQERRRFDAEVCVHDLPEIFHYWSNRHLRPFINGFGYDGIDDFFVKEIVRTPASSGGELLIASVGSGDCATEVGIARGLVASGFTAFRFVCLDISEGALERGRRYAVEAGLQDRFDMRPHDFNQGLPEGVYDVVMASQSLHHVVALERLYDSVVRHLAPEGCFLVSDIIGRNGHVRWPEARELVDELWEQLPDSYRYHLQLQRHEPRFMDWDCTYEGFEGIRAQEVLPLLLERLAPRVFIVWGNIIDVFIDRGFGHHFRHQTEWDRQFIDRVQAIDEQAIAEGVITPTHLLARFQREPGPCVGAPWMTPEGAVRIPRADDPPPPPPPRPTEFSLPFLPHSRVLWLRSQLRRVPGLAPLYRKLKSRF